MQTNVERLPVSRGAGPLALLLFALMLGLTSADLAMAYELGGPNASAAPASGSYAFDGAQWIAYRAAVQDPTNFGPSGLKAPAPLTTTALATITQASLSGLDGFVSPWWSDADSSPTEVTAVVEFFLSGGDLVLLQDDATHDAIGAQLGIPTALASDGSVSNGSAPLFSGPFGLAANVAQIGSRGQLSAGDVASARGTVVATNASGQITAAFWRRGAYAPGAGALLIVSDVDMWTSQASYGPLNANGIFALNATALLRAAPAYVLAGPAASLTPGSSFWSWEGGVAVSPYRSALDDSANFGPGGVVPLAIETSNLGAVDAGSLATADGFVASWWADADASAVQRTAVVDFFLAGGDLILLQDDSNHDPIGEQLGIPSAASSDGTPSNGGAPLFEGSFGRAANVVSTGFVAALSATDVAVHGGRVAATNTSGQITAAIWDRGDYAPGAGRLVIFADTDFVSVNTATYAPLNDNGRFALNATAFAVAARSYVLGGPGSELTAGNGFDNTFYAWDGGTSVSAYRAAIENPANFGPRGRVGGRAIQAVSLDNLTAATLAQLRGFVSPWWSDADTTPAQVDAVVDFFLSGGDLILLQDDSLHDEIGAALGLPITPSDGSVSGGGPPLHRGPFGLAAGVTQAGNTGQLAAGDVASHGGTVSGTNASGQITSAVWNAGQYAPGAGRLLIVTDIDMWTSLASYAPLNANGIYALNGTAFIRGPIVVAGPGAGLTVGNGSWSWEGGAFVSGYRAALETTTNFGPTGTVRVPLDAVDLASITPATLSGIDTFVAPWWSDAAASPSQRSALLAFFLAGGDLILLQDDSAHDPIGEMLGVPTQGAVGGLSNGGFPLFRGPFGTAVNVAQQGSVGRLAVTDVLPRGGVVGGTNAAGEITAAVWSPGAYAPGAGRLVVVTDIDMWATTVATYAPLNANGRFALNSTAIAVPEPTTGWLVASGILLVAALARKRRA